MKNTILKVSALFLMFGTMTSCEEDQVNFTSPAGDMAKFEISSGSLASSLDDDNIFEIPVSVTGVSNTDRMIVVSVDADETTALPEYYSIISNSLVVPAGEFEGRIKVQSNFDELPELLSFKLVLKLDEVGGAQIDPNNNVTTVSIFKVCPTDEDLSGTHTTILYDVHAGDGAGGGTSYPSFNSPGSVTWSSVGGIETGVYLNSDITFGLFTAMGVATPARRIQWICNGFTVLQPDQYGDTYEYTVNSVVGNTMELFFVNTWGDSGHVTLFRAGGADWPAVFQTE